MPAHRANNVETKRRCEDTPRPWADARYPFRPRIRGVRMALGPLRMFVSTTVKSSLGFAFFSRLHVRTLGKLLWGTRPSSLPLVLPQTHAFAMSSVAASASAAPTAPIKAPPQAGILEGVNPVHFDKNHPIILFIVQVCYGLLCCASLQKLSLWDASPI